MEAKCKAVFRTPALPYVDPAPAELHVYNGTIRHKLSRCGVVIGFQTGEWISTPISQTRKVHGLQNITRELVPSLDGFMFPSLVKRRPGNLCVSGGLLLFLWFSGLWLGAAAWGPSAVVTVLPEISGTRVDLPRKQPKAAVSWLGYVQIDTEMWSITNCGVGQYGVTVCL